MKIIYDHQIFAVQRFGGISRYFYELISRLCREADIDIALFLGFHINEYGIEAHDDRYGLFCGLKRPQIRKTEKLFSLLNRALFKPFFMASRADIYHPTYYADFSLNFKGKRVVTVYDMIHEIYPEYFGTRDRQLTTEKKRKAVLAADAIICISESTKRDVSRFFAVPEDRISVVYLANSLNFEGSSAQLVRMPYILFVGERGGYKNFDLLLEAYACSARLQKDFGLACFGGSEFTASERSSISTRGLNDRVFHYSGSDEVLSNLYRHASVFVSPSLYEGFGIPPLEAMHYGCPVLVSNTSSIPEVVGEAGHYFDTGSRDELVAGLEKIVYDEEMRRKLIKYGLEQEKKFSWDICATETMNLYGRL
jgi:glycosyltransferase involved in cell wall biosynthesis